MFKGLKPAAFLFLVLLVLGAFMVDAPAFESGEMEAAAKSLDYRQDVPAAVDVAESAPVFMVIYSTDQDQPAGCMVHSDADPVCILSRVPALASQSQIAIIRCCKNAIAARCRPVSINGKHARGLDPLKTVI